MKNSFFAMMDPTGFSTFFHLKACEYKKEIWYTILNPINHSQFNIRYLYHVIHKFLFVEEVVIQLRRVYLKLCFILPVPHLKAQPRPAATQAFTSK